jgi:hypothetical protein
VSERKRVRETERKTKRGERATGKKIMIKTERGK